MPGMPSIADLILESMPVNGAGFGELVLEYHSNFVALGAPEWLGPGAEPLKPQTSMVLSGASLPPEDVGREPEHLHISVHLEGHRSPTSVVTTGVVLTDPLCVLHLGK